MALFLFTAIALVATWQDAPGAVVNTAGQDVLATNLKDALEALTRLPDTDYGTRAIRYVVEGLDRNTTGLRSYLQRTVNPHAEFQVSLTTLDGRRVLWEDRQPTGETVGQRVIFTPIMDRALVVPEYATYDGHDMGLGLTVIPTRNGYPLDREIPIVVEAKTANGITFTTSTSIRITHDQYIKIGLADSSGNFAVGTHVSGRESVPIF